LNETKCKSYGGLIWALFGVAPNGLSSFLHCGVGAGEEKKNLLYWFQANFESRGENVSSLALPNGTLGHV
jgi:hypothetical protein